MTTRITTPKNAPKRIPYRSPFIFHLRRFLVAHPRRRRLGCARFLVTLVLDHPLQRPGEDVPRMLEADVQELGDRTRLQTQTCQPADRVALVAVRLDELDLVRALFGCLLHLGRPLEGDASAHRDRSESCTSRGLRHRRSSCGRRCGYGRCRLGLTLLLCEVHVCLRQWLKNVPRSSGVLPRARILSAYYDYCVRSSVQASVR